MALTMTPTTAAAMSAVSVDKAGVGSAVLNSMRQVGGSLGIAVMGAIVAAGVSSSLAAGSTQTDAFLHGFHDALRVAGLLALAGAIVATVAIRKVVHAQAPESEHARGDRGGVTQTRQRLTGRETAAGGARHRLPCLRRLELSRRDDGRDRARGRHHRADPLSPLRLEARPLPRLPRGGMGALRELADTAVAESPDTCLGAVADAFMAKRAQDPADRPLDPGR